MIPRNFAPYSHQALQQASVEQEAVKELGAEVTTARPATAPSQPTAVLATCGEKEDSQNDSTVGRQLLIHQNRPKQTTCNIESGKRPLEALPAVGRNVTGRSATAGPGGDNSGPNTRKGGGATGGAVEQAERGGSSLFRNEDREQDHRSEMARRTSGCLSTHAQPTENKESATTAVSLGAAMDVAVSKPLTAINAAEETNPTDRKSEIKESLEGRADSPLYRDMRLLEDSERRKALLTQLLTGDSDSGTAAEATACSEERAVEPSDANNARRGGDCKRTSGRERSSAGASLGEFKVKNDTNE